MQFKVESAGITHRLPVGVASPQRCCACVTVGTEGTCALADNLKHRKRYSQAFQTTLVMTDYLFDGLQRRQKGPVIPVSFWVGLEVYFGRSSCGTVHRHCTGSGLYHPCATEG